jgi:uncharacterized protein
MRAIGFRLWAALSLVVIVVFAGAARSDGLEALEIARDEASRARGLMDRRFMPADHGMLFEFEREAPEAFWMKDTYIPLDMIFISRAGVVTNVVANAEPLSERAIPSGPPCMGVLELNGGAAARIGLKVGDRVRHPFFKP